MKAHSNLLTGSRICFLLSKGMEFISRPRELVPHRQHPRFTFHAWNSIYDSLDFQIFCGQASVPQWVPASGLSLKKLWSAKVILTHDDNHSLMSDWSNVSMHPITVMQVHFIARPFLALCCAIQPAASFLYIMIKMIVIIDNHKHFIHEHFSATGTNGIHYNWKKAQWLPRFSCWIMTNLFRLQGEQRYTARPAS